LYGIYTLEMEERARGGINFEAKVMDLPEKQVDNAMYHEQ